MDLASREKRSVALLSVGAAVLLTSSKLLVGLLTGSLGLLSEAAHSGLDLVAAVVTYFAVRVAGSPPDQEHTYGHGKVENLSALFETLLLLATCGWIVQEAVGRLLFARPVVEVNVWSFVVICASIVIDVSRSRALRHAAEKHRSQALEADALHFSTDIWSSAVVLLGLICVWLADRLGAAWLVQADSVAALGVAAIVVVVSLRLGKRTVDDLLDAVPPALREQVATAARVPGVLDVLETRVRRSGPESFVEILLSVDRSAPFEQANAVTKAAVASVQRLLPGAHVVIHAEPVQPEEEGLEARVRLLAARLGVGVHSIRVSARGGEQRIDLHMEVGREMTVAQAHAKADDFEAKLRAEHPGIGRITTHLEPVENSARQRMGAAAIRELVQAALAATGREWGMQSPPHDIEVLEVEGELVVTCCCPIDPDAPITEAHELTRRLEQGLRSRLPQVARVVIHVEPGPRKA